MVAPFTTDAAVDQFRRDGYLALDDAIDPLTLTALRTAADAVLADVVAATMADRATHERLTWWRLPDGHAYIFKIKPVVDLAPVLTAVVEAPPVRSLAHQLLGGPVALMENKITYKMVLADPAPWADLPVLGEEVCRHTDAAYFAARGFGQVLTVALCLDDCPAEAGALRVWPGSHHRTPRQVTTPDQGPVVVDEDAPDAQAVTLVARAGALLAWDARLVHASDPNRTGRPRRLLVLGYSPAGR